MLSLSAADPFNRLHLTIGMVEPVPELKQRIKDWLDEKMATAAAASSSSAPSIVAETEAETEDMQT